MGESSSQVEREIASARLQLGRNLQELEDKARRLSDWREHYDAHTGAFLGAAAGAGLLLGLLTVPHRSRGTKPPRQTFAPTSAGAGATRQYAQKFAHHTGSAAEDILAALGGVAVARLAEWIDGLVPGFRDHYKGPMTDRSRPTTL